MLQKIFQRFANAAQEKELKRLRSIVSTINSFEEEYQQLSEEQLKGKTAQLKERIGIYTASARKEVEEAQQLLDQVDESDDLERKKDLQVALNHKKKELFDQEQGILREILPEAFAVHKNACRRLVGQKFMLRGKEIVWDMIPFDVQLIGGMILHEGKIAEMKTGEGKTLVATLPLYLNSLVGRGVHLVTVNEYLAQRDAEWMGFLFQYLGLSVGVVLTGMGADQKKKAYAADITYGTNNEFGFDYLRDNMSVSPEAEVQRELYYAIVDEVDSILIDEARTPLIISAPAEESTSKYTKYAALVQSLMKDDHYVIDEKMKTATLTEAGIKRMEELLGVDNIYTEAGFGEVHHIEQALKARAVFQRDIDYIVRDGEVLIVDEFTGRILPGRRYSDGLHQSIEAKENVEVKRESRTLATITFQNYFRLFFKLSGMTGTALTEAEEFAKIYKLEVMEIPTNRDMVRQDKPDTIYKTELAKFQAVVERIKEKQEKGQPVLVGTIAIEKSEFLSELLRRAGVQHHVLNAKQHEKEAEIIANAGQKGAVTIATNMAGRGTDIKLAPEVKEVGGLVIMGTERHESRRIDNQLRGRAGRQGDPGESQFFVSLEDNLMRIFGGDRIRKMMEFLKIPEEVPIENKMISSALESAQKRVEGYHFDVRKHVVEYDDVMNRHREIIYSRRRKILHKPSVKSDIQELIADYVTQLVFFHVGSRSESEWDLEGLSNEVKALHADESLFGVKAFENFQSPEGIRQYLFDSFRNLYVEKERKFSDSTMMRNVERGVYLRSIDMLWMDHLDHMQGLRDAVSMSGYAQKDPLVEYKKEGFQAFQKLLGNVNRLTVQTLFKLQLDQRGEQALSMGEAPRKIVTNAAQIEGNLGNEIADENSPAPKTVKVSGPVQSEPKVGRNDLCPCGSGKKYKKCHGQEG